MKKIIREFFVVFILLSMMPNNVRAENGKTNVSSATGPLTMADAIKIAITNNPELKASVFSERAAQSSLGQARAGFLPVINFTETFKRTNTPMWVFGNLLNQGKITKNDFNPSILNDPDAINNFTSLLSISMPVYSGGRIYNSFKKAELNSRIAGLMHKQTEQGIIAKTSLAYTGLLLAKKNFEVILQSLKSANASLRLVQSRYSNGFSVKSDLLRAKVRIADLEQQRLSANNRIEIAKSYLNAAMGLPVDTPVNVDAYFKKSSEPEGYLIDFIRKAVKNRPELQILRLKKEIAVKGIKIAESAHLPSINIFANYENNSEDLSNGQNDYSLGAAMHINLFSGFGINSKINSAKLSLNRIREIHKSMETGIKIQTRQAWLDLKTAWKRIHVADSALEQAVENLRIIRNRYENGLLTIVSLLDAELADQRARANHFNAVYDYESARIKLALASGTLNADFK